MSQASTSPHRSRPNLRLGSLPTMQSTSDEVVTSVFLSNLHCNSCVQTIREALLALSPAPTSIDISIVTQSVTVRHPLALYPQQVKRALDKAGFDIVATPSQTADQYPSSFFETLSRLNPLFSAKRAKHIQQCAHCQAELSRSASPPGISRVKLGEKGIISVHGGPRSATSASIDKSAASPPPSSIATVPHYVTLSVGGMTCASCTGAITRCLSALPGVSEVVVSLLNNSATFKVDSPNRVQEALESIVEIGYDAELVSSKRLASGPYRVSVSVDGMTCASCSNTIMDLLSPIPGVSDVVVSLLGKTATATIDNTELSKLLVETISDAGFVAELLGLEDLSGEARVGPRTVSLRIGGMYCSQCPPKVIASLDPFKSKLQVIEPLPSCKDPILRLSYTPEAPSFTIRTIIKAISDTPSNSSETFIATVETPLSPESRARAMQRREQQAYLHRLLFSVIVAIPTFIIAVVYMSLVPSSNSTRKWFMKPIWAGNASRADWALLFLATPVMFYSAGSFHRHSLRELMALWKKGSTTPVWKRFVRFGSMNLLVSTGVSVAYFSSIALLILAAVGSPSPSGQGDSSTYFDSVVFLTMFLLIGRWLESYSKGRTSDAIGALGKLRPSEAQLLVPASEPSRASPTSTLRGQGSEDVEKAESTYTPSEGFAATSGMRVEKVSADLLDVGDVVRVIFGVSPPLDGVIVAGEGSFDESSLTGESNLVKKALGDTVFVGTLNKGGVVDIKIDKIGGETMLDHIVKVVRDAQGHRAPIERVADLLTGYFVPVVTLLAILTWVIWLSLGFGGVLPRDYLDIPVGGWAVWSLEFAIAVFVVACPCGIGLAAPTALLVGSGLAAKYGILARKGGEAFQEAAQLDIVAFDKTGTLTQGGDPRVTNIEVFAEDEDVDDKRSFTEEVILGIAAAVESASAHPLASAIRSYCQQKDASYQSGSDFEVILGKGMKAIFEELDSTVIIGNEALIVSHGCVIEDGVQGTLNSWKSQGKSIVLMAIRRSITTEEDDTPFHIRAIFSIADELRPEARSVIERLQSRGIQTWMISGDNETTAKAVARAVGIPESNVYAGVLPDEKASRIKELKEGKRELSKWQRLVGAEQSNGRLVVAMVGDGVNDAPALTEADVGIAIGSGSDVALSSAAFILVSSNLNTLLTLTDLSRTVFNRIKFNFLWATIYNVIALPIAAGVIYPAGHARLAPVWASLAMALSSVSVVCSSLLLRLYKEPRL